jgi:hypothetical protein
MGSETAGLNPSASIASPARPRYPEPMPNQPVVLPPEPPPAPPPRPLSVIEKEQLDLLEAWRERQRSL